MIAHGRDPDASLVDVGNTADRRACRHHQGERHHDVRRREADIAGAARDEAEEPGVAGVPLQAFDQLGRRRMADELELDAELHPKRLRERYDDFAGAMAMDFAARRILDELRQMQPDANLAGLHDVTDPPIEARLLLRIGACHCRHERKRCKQCGMRSYHVSPSADHRTGNSSLPVVPIAFRHSVSGRSTALATARRASTPTRCARYSALPWMSLLIPSASIVMPSSDFGPKRFLSASSNDGTRNTPFPPAPVTATRISELRLATNTPTSAKREAGLGNLM